ncbi:MAG: heavy-metal-associated domain-containing protein [Cytophagales bacterium]|nr:heavy-metal-associated domain-containing protein [Armatimonadota bacterium]
MTTTTITAPDIECDGCANAIKRAVGALPGVSEVVVEVATKRVTVTHDAATAPRETVTAAMERAGFPVS